MKMLLRAIMRAVRRAMRAAARAARGVGGAVDGFLGGLFAGPYLEELEEGGLDELVEDTDFAARAEANRLARTPVIREWSPAGLVKRAVELRAAGQPYDRVFDLDDPEQKRLYLYVQALDETGVRAITHMPAHTLARHLEETEFRASGLRPVGQQIVLDRERREATELKAPVPTRRRGRGPSIVSDAIAVGRKLTLEEVVSASRGRAA